MGALFQRGYLAAALLAAVVAGCGDDSGSSQSSPASIPVPWQRTEPREPCDNAELLRQPFFGDIHIHTGASADAYIYGTRMGPRDAYVFARGGQIDVSDEHEQQSRRARIDRPLDFAAVTDHSEWFGEVQYCTTPGSLLYDDPLCELLRVVDPPGTQFTATVNWLYLASVVNPPPSLPFCETPGVDCDAAAVSVWQQMQAAADEAYDRSPACTFTTFVGYEQTPSLIGRHQHRNVIFRNHNVPPYAASYLETARGGFPQGLWTAIEDTCLNAGIGCDAIIIPHNSNLSGGLQFPSPADAAEAQRRQDREPLVELHQQKGNSECRFDRLAGMGAGTEDELCAYEQILAAHQTPNQIPPTIDRYPRRNLVRNVLKDGLAFEQTLGANPFRFGFVGSTDTHNATGGNVEEVGWEGGEGSNDASAAKQIADALDSNPGGLAAVWAEENSRDAIFTALKRRETYATTGVRPVLRFFAGDLDRVRCGAADFVARGYQTGTPMGGDIGAVRGDDSPRFAVLALKDAGTRERPGVDLQRVQIVKGWVDAKGETHERVYDVAGRADNGAGVDPRTCRPTGRGARELCAVWEDPDFDRTQRAFYYARVLENPICRWSTVLCKSVNVDPFSADCASQAAAAGEAFADCCLTEADEPFFSPIVQERAWSSPVWYRPESIAAVDGGIEFGGAPGSDRLELRIRLGASPIEDGVQTQDLIVAVSDDDEIFRAEIPAGTLQREGASARYSAAPGGAIDSVAVDEDVDGDVVIALRSAALDLSAAARADHMVVVEVTIGGRRINHTRLWQVDGNGLRTGEPDA